MSDAVTSAGNPRVGTIEGMRAVAAGLVLYYHVQRLVQFMHPALVPSWLVPWNERLGTFGVGIFFVLSGFLLYRPFAAAAIDATPRPALGAYYLRRFARIYPAYWVALAFLVLVVGPNQIHTPADAVVYFGLLQNYRTGSMLLGLGVAWTLVIEVSFYVVLPGLARLLRSSSEDAGRRVRRQVAGLAVLAAVGVLVRVWSYWYRPTGHARLGAFQPHLVLDAWIPGFLDWFALGMALAVAAVWFDRHGTPAWLTRWFGLRVWPAWLATIVIYRLVLEADFPRPGQRLTPGTHMLVNTALPIAAALLVAPLVLVPAGRGLGRWFLTTRVAVAVGTISYGIYLWHLTFVRQVAVWISARDLPKSAGLMVVIVLTLTFAAATASYFLVEAPLMRWSARVVRRGPARAPVPADS